MEEIYKRLLKVPKGKVTTYKELGKALGLHPRVVGMLMKKNPYAPRVPCHRVVLSSGKVGGYSGKGGKKSKIKMLKSEGVKIKGDKIVNFKDVLYCFDS